MSEVVEGSRAAYSSFVAGELDLEVKRRESMDNRAMATVVSSGTIIALGGTILTATGSVGTRAHSLILFAAALAFLSTIGLALAAGLPMKYRAAEVG